MDPVTWTAILYGSAGTATTAATTGLIGTAGAFSLGTALTTGVGLFSAFSAYSQGQAASDQAHTEALLQEVSLAQSNAAGAQKEADTIKQLRRTLAAQDAGFAASGLVIGAGSGTPAQARIDSLAEGNRQLSTVRFNTASDATTYRLGGYAANQRARNARQQGYLGATVKAGGTFASALNRGF